MLKAALAMTVMFEVYYKPPSDISREAAMTEQVPQHGGRLSYREPEDAGLSGICLTYEFDDCQSAERAAEFLRRPGEHVEGPVDYGP